MHVLLCALLPLMLNSLREEVGLCGFIKEVWTVGAGVLVLVLLFFVDRVEVECRDEDGHTVDRELQIAL